MDVWAVSVCLSIFSVYCVWVCVCVWCAYVCFDSSSPSGRAVSRSVSGTVIDRIWFYGDRSLAFHPDNPYYPVAELAINRTTMAVVAGSCDDGRCLQWSC